MKYSILEPSLLFIIIVIQGFFLAPPHHLLWPRGIAKFPPTVHFRISHAVGNTSNVHLAFHEH